MIKSSPFKTYPAMLFHTAWSPAKGDCVVCFHSQKALTRSTNNDKHPIIMTVIFIPLEL